MGHFPEGAEGLDWTPYKVWPWVPEGADNGDIFASICEMFLTTPLKPSQGVLKGFNGLACLHGAGHQPVEFSHVFEFSNVFEFSHDFFEFSHVSYGSKKTLFDEGNCNLSSQGQHAACFDTYL